MAGNSIGQLFRVTTCGESHGVGLMAIVDGVPPGLALTEEDLQKIWIAVSREPRNLRLSVKSLIRLKSFLVCLRVNYWYANWFTHSQYRPKSKDYGNIAQTFRPGHADYTYTQSMVSATIAAVVVQVLVKLLCVLQLVLLRRNI